MQYDLSFGTVPYSNRAHDQLATGVIIIPNFKHCLTLLKRNSKTKDFYVLTDVIMAMIASPRGVHAMDKMGIEGLVGIAERLMITITMTSKGISVERAQLRRSLRSLNSCRHCTCQPL